MTTDVAEHARAILEYWFGPLDDSVLLDRTAEPFRTQYTRWYGKDERIDLEIRQRFEPLLIETVADGAGWDRKLARWRAVENGMLALTILLDQLPRNMYRGSARMYAHDPLALSVCCAALGEGRDRGLPLCQRMFLYVPLMHVENLTLQQRMLALFEELVASAATESPQNLGFFGFACDYARRHLDVIRDFGRFPHRNPLLGRISTPEELELLGRDPGF